MSFLVLSASVVLSSIFCKAGCFTAAGPRKPWLWRSRLGGSLCLGFFGFFRFRVLGFVGFLGVLWVKGSLGLP